MEPEFGTLRVRLRGAWRLWRSRKHIVVTGDAVWRSALRWTFRKPCGALTPEHSGGYSHWYCQRTPGHRSAHRFNNYIWMDGGQVQHAPDHDWSGLIQPDALVGWARR